MLNIAGCFIKTFVNDNLAFLYIGQLFAAVAQPIYLNAPAKIASTWFRDDRRAIVTSIGCSSATLGIIFGFIFPSFIVNEKDAELKYKENIHSYLFYVFIISLICCIPVLFFFRSKPKNPPR